MVFFQSKIVSFGTPEFAGIVLESLIKNGFKPNLIITQPDQPLGRKQKLTSPPVKELALSNGLKIAQPKNKIELKKIFEKDKVDLAILVAYGMIIPAEILKKPVYGFLNYPAYFRLLVPLYQVQLDIDPSLFCKCLHFAGQFLLKPKSGLSFSIYMLLLL